MARSATVWAAALVLASFSGSGPLLTTAEAMPAPGPQQTQMRPRYYFPRHVKRQIVTNSTAPAAPTTSPSSSSTTSNQVESRQIDLSSILAPFFSNDGSETSEVVSSRSSNSRTSTTTQIQEIVVTPVPDSSESLPGTGNQRPSPVPVSPEPVEPAPQPPSSPARGSTGRTSDGTSSPAFTPQPQAPESEPAQSSPGRSSSSARNPLGNLPIFGSTGVLPPVVVPASSSVSTAPSTTPEENERPIPTPSPTPSPSPSPVPSAPVGNLLSSLLGGVVGPTASSPAPVQPSPTPETPSEDGQRVGSTGAIPEIIVPVSSTPVVASSEPSAPVASSFSGPFIVPGSTGGGIPSPIVSPTPSQGLVGGLLSTLLNEPEPTPTQQVGSTGVLPSDPVQPTPAPVVAFSSPVPIVQPSSGGIVVGITTALGTGASPTPTGAIPTSEAILPSEPLNLPSILSSLVSEVTGVFPTGSAGPTAGPTAPVSPSPVPEPSGIVPPAVSSLISEVSSLLPTIIPDPAASVLPSILTSLLETPTATGSAPLPPASSIIQSLISDISSGIFPTGVPTDISSGIFPSGVPTASGDVPTPTVTPSAGITPPIPSETLSIPTSPVTVPSVSETPTPSGLVPSSGVPTGSGVSSGPTVVPTSIEPTSIPASESPVSTSAPVPTSAVVTPPSSANATISETPTFVIPPSSVVESPVITSTPAPVQSQRPMGSDSATSLVIGTTIIQETTSNVPASSTAIGIPSSLPKMIAPPGGVPTDVPADSFMGQVCFKWQLNYPFVSANDGGKQIFHYLPKAIADGLNISISDVQNIGLKPLDTTAYQGFITTLALFTIPKDLQGTLAAQIRNPLDAFYHNENGTVNALTNLINTACPLPAGGKLPGDNSSPNQGANPGASPTGGSGDGGALGGDINASRPVNASAAGIATGAIVGAIAYGAAMFFVARRYRNKRIAHQRSSSVPSTGSRMTYGSIPGGAAAWMHGARNGRFTPGSRGSQGSSSTQGRSVRTQQISAPVMAENSLGWN